MDDRHPDRGHLRRRYFSCDCLSLGNGTSRVKPASGSTTRASLTSLLEHGRLQVRLFENFIYGFYRRYPKRFVPICLIEAAFHLLGIFEVWFILSRISSADLLSAFLLESVSRLITIVFKLIPVCDRCRRGGCAIRRRNCCDRRRDRRDACRDTKGPDTFLDGDRFAFDHQARFVDQSDKEDGSGYSHRRCDRT